MFSVTVVCLKSSSIDMIVSGVDPQPPTPIPSHQPLQPSTNPSPRPGYVSGRRNPEVTHTAPFLFFVFWTTRMSAMFTALDIVNVPGWHWAGISLAALALWSLKAKSGRNPGGLPLPPGPKGVPFFGNMFQIASGKSWEKYRSWGKTYGLLEFTGLCCEGLTLFS
jgi:hypothetical protein